MRKQTSSHNNSATNSYDENVVNGNSNASSVESHDDYDDETAGASTIPPFKTNSITATNNILTNLSRLNAHHLNSTNTNYRKEMGGFSIPHHSLSAAFYGYHSHANQMSSDCLTSVTSNITTAQHQHNSPTHSYPVNTTSSSSNSNIGSNISTIANSNNGIASSNNAFNPNKSSPFLLPAQLYKSLFANAVLHNTDKMCPHPFPRNLLFSYSDKSPNSPDFEHEEKHSISDEVSLVSIKS